MMLKKMIIALAAVLLTGVLAFSNTAFAEDGPYECTLTGYSFMGGSGFKTNQGYFIATPMEYWFSGTDMYGFAFLKFDTIGTETVEKAYLNLDLVSVGAMDLMDATDAFPGFVDVYSPGNTDVASFTSVADTNALHAVLKADPAKYHITRSVAMTSNGVWAIDITELYNSWVTGTIPNNGIILYSNSVNAHEAGGTIGAVGTKYAGLDGSNGKKPLITFSIAPSVTITSPEDSAEGVDVGSQVTIKFDNGMKTESTQSAFSMTLAGDAASTISGTFSWDDSNTELTFTPADLLTHETAYTVTVTTDAMSSSDKNLKAKCSFSFTTGPYVAPVPKLSGEPEGTIAKDSVSIKISGTGVYAYRYCLDAGDWSNDCDPSDALELSSLTDGDHTLKIKIMDSLEAWTDLEDVSFSVQAPPEVVSVSPENKASAAVNKLVKVVFSEAMNQDTVEAGFAISPDIDGTLAWENARTLVFTPSLFFDEETQYKVSISATAADLAGNSLGTACSWSFTTLVANNVRCEVTADTYVLYGGMGGGKGYPQGSSMGEFKLKAGAVYIVDARILMRLDLTPLTDLGLSAEDIESAYLMYTMFTNTESMDVGPPAPEGTPMYGFVHALDNTTCEKTKKTGLDKFEWTEAVSGEGYVSMDNKPWYVAGAPYVLATHTTGPYAEGRIDIAPIVKGWMDGSWDNDGLEIRDQDDQSWGGDSTVYGSEYGDGYSWHIGAREDTKDGPYLMVVYDTDKLRIDNRSDSSKTMSPGDTRTLTASGGSGTCLWTITSPDGNDISSSVLPVSSGPSVTFTAPGQCGLYTISLTRGDDADRIYIGVGNVSGTPQAPLYLPGDVSDEKASLLTGICVDALEQMGGFGSFAVIDLDDKDGTRERVGGTAREGGAKMVIASVGNPSDISGERQISFETLSGDTVSVSITSAGVSSDIGQLYVLVVDTGNNSPGGGSGLFLFELYDENGEALSNDDISTLEITMPYDAEITDTDDPFSNGAWKIVHAPDLKSFYSGGKNADLEDISTDNIVSVNNVRYTVTFDTDHCSVYGAVTGVETEAAQATPPEDLGGGCFIGSLLH